jgi:hypothetical protein
MFEDILNPPNRSLAVLPGFGTFWLLSVWEPETCFRRGGIRVHRGIPFGKQGVTDYIGMAELGSVFDAWIRRLSECIIADHRHTPGDASWHGAGRRNYSINVSQTGGRWELGGVDGRRVKFTSIFCFLIPNVSSGE